MQSHGAAIVEWVCAALSMLLAVAYPIFSWQYVHKKNHLRELWQASRPGSLMTMWIIAIILISISAVLFSLGASIYPPLGGLVLLHVGVVTALLIVVVSYVRFARQQLAQQMTKDATIADDQTPVN